MIESGSPASPEKWSVGTASRNGHFRKAALIFGKRAPAPPGDLLGKPPFLGEIPLSACQVFPPGRNGAGSAFGRRRFSP